MTYPDEISVTSPDSSGSLSRVRRQRRYPEEDPVTSRLTEVPGPSLKFTPTPILFLNRVYGRLLTVRRPGLLESAYSFQKPPPPIGDCPPYGPYDSSRTPCRPRSSRRPPPRRHVLCHRQDVVRRTIETQEPLQGLGRLGGKETPTLPFLFFLPTIPLLYFVLDTFGEHLAFPDLPQSPMKYTVIINRVEH